MDEVKIKRESRLNFSDLLQIDDIVFWDLNDLGEYTVRGDEFFHYVQGGDRMDLLSYKYYQTPDLLWVIAWANNIELYPNQLNIGDTIIIPSPTFVKQQLIR